MRLLKWLFQPAYLLLIIVLVALYVNRESIFPEKVVESLEAEALVAKVENLSERLRAQYEGSGTAVTEQEDSSQEETSQPVEAVEPPVAIEEGSAEVAQAPLAAEESPAAVEELAAAEVVETTVADAAPLNPPEEAQAVVSDEGRGLEAPTPAAEQSAEPQEEETATEDTTGVTEGAVAAVVPQAPVEPTPPSEVSEPQQAEMRSPLTAWRSARAAVWQGDLESAVAQYRTLIAMQPDNFDAYGEMGNVLLAQSNVAAAAEAYATAARLIRQAGHRDMAWRVAGIVAQLDEEQGRALYEEFSR